MRRALPLLILALMLAACGSTSAPSDASEPELDDAGAQLADVQKAIAEVAAEQDEVDPALGQALTAVRHMDEIIAGLRDAETVDAAKDQWDAADAAMADADLEPLRPQIHEVAFAVDDARSEIKQAADVLESAWERRYLEAEADVLTAVREHAKAADALVQILERHWPTYQQLRERTAKFVEQRWFYRSSAEAADAYRVKIDGLLDELRTAQKQIAQTRDTRERAAQAVNEATAEAAEVWEARPSGAGA